MLSGTAFVLWLYSIKPKILDSRLLILTEYFAVKRNLSESEMKISFKEAKALSLEKAIVNALDGGLYTVNLVHGHNLYCLVDDSRKNHIFHCIEDVKSSLRKLGLSRFSLIQQSAYDEMLGQPPKVENRLNLVLTTRAAGE